MALQLSPKTQARIIRMIENGDYADADTMLNQGLDLLTAHGRFMELKAKIAVGAEEVADGKLVEFTPELRETLWQSALKEAAGERSTSNDAHS